MLEGKASTIMFVFQKIFHHVPIIPNRLEPVFFAQKKKTTVVFFLMIGFDLVGLPWATRHLFDFDIKEVQSLFSDCKPARQNPFSPSEEVLGENKKKQDSSEAKQSCLYC